VALGDAPRRVERVLALARELGTVGEFEQVAKAGAFRLGEAGGDGRPLSLPPG
jgi:hypothetical protein